MSLDVDGQLEGPKNVAAVVIPVGAVGEMSSKWHFVVKSFLLVDSFVIKTASSTVHV